MSDMPPCVRQAACIGGGVIGAGWIARLLLCGVDVAAFDPDPGAADKIGAVVEHAARAFARLIAAPLPPRGRLRLAASIEDAVAGADFVQESVPERLELKHRVLRAIDAAAPAATLIGSSTSGLLPSELQAPLRHPGRLVVAHPYNPVYLLPLVELVGGRQTAPATLERAQAVYTSIGMEPVLVRREIDAFVGDRLLEALWREALWLVHDDVATVTEIDEVIRCSFGLRWAQMGLFQTYRIAGGEAGMRHFLAQFGPCLTLPWTKLTDVPDLTDALIDKIARQSDEQAAGLSIRELERIRDDNLIGILQALRAHDGGEGWGAGRALRAFEDGLLLRARQAAGAAPHDPAGPLRLLELHVDPAWIDYNGHMTEHRYLQVAGEATDAFLRLIGVDQAYLAGGHSYYTVETHIMHRGQAAAGDPLIVESQVLGADEKRLHLVHQIRHDGSDRLLASAEHMLLHVDTPAGRSCAVLPAVAARLRPLVEGQARLPRPDAVGRHVGWRN